MALLSVSEIREHVETPLDDDSVQRLLDALEAEIIRYAGEIGSHTDYLTGRGAYLMLPRPVASITSITERTATGQTANDYLLAADDYVIVGGAMQLLRLYSGTRPRREWLERVTVVSVSQDDTAIRIGVLIDLFKLAEGYAPGLNSETVGSWTTQITNSSTWNASTERDAILSRLIEHGRIAVV